MSIFSFLLSVALVFWSSSAMAQSNDTLDNLLEQLIQAGGEEAVMNAICPAYIESDNDLEFPPEALPECAAFSGSAKLEAQIILSSESRNPGLGVDLLEARNKWGWTEHEEERMFLVTVVNPYPVDLTSILIEYNNGDCSSARGDRYRIEFDRPVEPREAVVVSFDSPIQNLAPSGCLDIVGSETKPLEEGQASITKILPTANAGQWQEAVLLAEAIMKSGVSIDRATLADLESAIELGVRPVPSSDSLTNFRGYAALSALARSNADLAEKLERYRAASVSARRGLFIEAFEKNSPFVNSGQVLNSLSSEKTRIQRDEAWAHIKDKEMTVTGTVSDVQPAGLILPTSIVLDVGRNARVVCYLQNFLADASTSVRLGSSLTCSGRIFEYTLIFDTLSVSLREAVFRK